MSPVWRADARPRVETVDVDGLPLEAVGDFFTAYQHEASAAGELRVQFVDTRCSTLWSLRTRKL